MSPTLPSAPLLAIDGEHRELPGSSGRGARGCLDGALDLARLSFVDEAELLGLRARIFDEFYREALLRMLALTVERPVLLGDEGGDLRFALADHAQRRTLHATCGEAAAHLLP